MDISEVKRIWSEVKLILRDTIPAHAYYSWVEAMEAVEFDNGVFTILTVHQVATQIVKSYSLQITDAFEKVLGRRIDFKINYDADLAQKYQKEMKKESLRPKINRAEENKALENLAQMQSSSNLKFYGNTFHGI